ncbi:cytosine-specific methyltransferase [Sphingobacterium faecium NBRC 15299]|uniref:DNA cytosine methyltransferase n=1 Tax=Sphingobacterium faecium TaxID=34087 RepID=UPI000D36245E|nr:DNA (cytosine-5-)-methyltransferase [Sphingobacterium faecium]PTX14111.1 DNA (cytosine-5)-methyltransferase 1 [Sphingobacterium faecium]GEM64191.1 cytosine-specific methyltransferase [Sphingobacterium faecium NBRC 15299]
MLKGYSVVEQTQNKSPKKVVKGEKVNSNKYKEFNFIDLFAGIGGFHIAMHHIGGKCVFASEIDKFARITYEHNYKKWSPELFENGNFNQDITDPALDYNKIPAFDLLCAGFPCQPFSHAGLKKGFGDTRGTLFFNIEEIVRTKIEAATKENNNHLIPKVLFLENVKGLRNHDKGRTFETIKSRLEELGYEVRAEVLNSKNFGIPQNRERIFIVAWYKDLIKVNDFKFPYGLDQEGNAIYDRAIRDTESVNTTVGQILLDEKELEAFEAKNSRTYTISEKLWDGHQRRKKEHGEKGNGFGYSLFQDDSQYTSTISARYYKDGSEILIDQSLLEKRPRKLHPVEAARLQGYPIDEKNANEKFEIPVSDAQAYKQFGNSVSVPVIKTLAKEIINQLLK